MAKKIRITFVLIFLAINSDSALFAGQAARQYAVGYLNAQRALSPEESRLANCLIQRAEILKNLSKSKSPYILRHQLKILNGKITDLENKIKRNRKNGQVAVAGNRAATPVVFSAPKKTIVAYPMAPSKKVTLPAKIKTKSKPPKIFQAQIVGVPESRSSVSEPKKLPPLTPLKKPIMPVGREIYRFENPARAPVIKQIQLPSQQILVVPPPAVSKLKIIKPITPVPISAMGSDVQATYSEALQSQIQKAPAISVTTPTIEGIEPVITSQTPSSARLMPTAVPIEALTPTVVPVETEKLIPSAETQETTALRGLDWAAMSRDEKEMYVFSAMGALVKHDVVSMKPSYFYIKALDNTLEKNPLLKNRYLDDIFISSIYENEPDTRIAIDKIRS